MGLRKTEAIVLKSIDYGETSKIVKLQTPKFGKISVIAKGAKKPKSKFSGYLEELNYISIVFYYKEEKELFLLSQCDLIKPNLKIKEDLNKITIAFAVVELLLRTEISEESHVGMFNLLLRVLKELNDIKKYYTNIYIYFILYFLKLSGYQMDFSRCLKCKKTQTKEKWNFSIENGGLYCSDCLESGFNVDIGIQKVMHKFSFWELDRLINLALSEKEYGRILHMLTCSQLIQIQQALSDTGN